MLALLVLLCSVVTHEELIQDQIEKTVVEMIPPPVKIEPTEPLVVQTKDMPGETFTERWVQAFDKVKDHKGKKEVVVEEGWQRVDKTLIPNNQGELLRGLTIRSAGFTRLFWGTEIPDTYKQPMVYIHASWMFDFGKITLCGKRWNEDGSRHDVYGDCGFVMDAGWEYNTRHARHINIHDIQLQNFETGCWIGSPFGADVTSVNLQRFNMQSVRRAMVFEGANLAAVDVGPGTVGGNELLAAVTVINSPPKWFSRSMPMHKRCLNPFGVARELNRYNTPAYNQFIFDDERRNRNHKEFDEKSAKTIGGCPDVTIHDLTVNSHYNSELKNVTRAAFDFHNAFAKVKDVRIEGDASVAVLRNDWTNMNMHRNRFSLILDNVDVTPKYNNDGTLSNRPSFIIKDKVTHNPCAPIYIRGGFYPRGDLPEQSDNPAKGIVVWDTPRSLTGVLR